MLQCLVRGVILEHRDTTMDGLDPLVSALRPGGCFNV